MHCNNPKVVNFASKTGTSTPFLNLLLVSGCLFFLASCGPDKPQSQPPKNTAPKPTQELAKGNAENSELVRFKQDITNADKLPTFSDEDIQAGKKLAQTYCQSCHLLPSPDLLDKKTWYRHVMPNMSVRLGAYTENNIFYDKIPDRWFEQGKGGERVKQAQVFPEKSQVTEKQWNQLVAYYTSEAPETPIASNKPLNIQTFYFPFKTHIPDMAEKLTPATTFVKIKREGGEIFVGEASHNSLRVFDAKGDLLRKMAFNSAPVHLIQFSANSFLVTAIGSIPATDNYRGEIVMVRQHPETNKLSGQLILKDLGRPVHTSIANLNNDKQTDLVVSEFGNWTGSISWFEKKQERGFYTHKLKTLPGSLSNYPVDYDKDGDKDILVLKAHGDEGIFLFSNDGDGNFTESTLVRFPPSYGSNFMQVIDFNKDGHLDAITTAGDNADYPPILKRYHGIRLFLNQGDGTLKEDKFFPLHGAIRAHAFDYDLDGDYDIAAIAFFPDFKANLKSSFVLLDNKGPEGFRPYSFKDAGASRWMAMDVADLDGDGDKDIVLGAHNMEADLPEEIKTRWRKKSAPLVILENKKN